MSVDQFLGKWLEVKKEGFQCLAEALGLSTDQQTFFEKSQSELEYCQEGDDWTIRVGIVGVPHNTAFTFKMGQEYDSTNIDGSPLKSIIRQDGPRLTERHESTGPRHFVMDIVREIDGGTMKATTTIGGISMLTTYSKV